MTGVATNSIFLPTNTACVAQALAVGSISPHWCGDTCAASTLATAITSYSTLAAAAATTAAATASGFCSTTDGLVGMRAT